MLSYSRLFRIRSRLKQLSLPISQSFTDPSFCLLRFCSSNDKLVQKAQQNKKDVRYFQLN